MIQWHLHMPDSDQDFNWVEACGACSERSQFNLMRRKARELVDTRMSQIANVHRSDYLKLESYGPKDWFVVWSDRIEDGRTVSMKRYFRLESGKITVSTNLHVAHTITPTLNDEGEFRFKIDGKGCYLRWEVLKHFLEPLFRTETQLDSARDKTPDSR